MTVRCQRYFRAGSTPQCTRPCPAMAFRFQSRSPPHNARAWKLPVRLDLLEVTFMAYCTGRIPALHFCDRVLACFLQLCAKSTLIQCWRSAAITMFTDGPLGSKD
jgi:hypothetical protein